MTEKKNKKKKIKKAPAPLPKRKGRHTKYDPEVHPLKAWALAQKGFINKQIAAGLRISTATLDSWQRKFPEFLSAIREGKEVVDAKVERALLKRALGYRTVEKRIIQNPDGTTRKEVIDKEVPGDAVAQKFWLCNRKPETWKERRAVTGEDGQAIPVTLYIPDNGRKNS